MIYLNSCDIDMLVYSAPRWGNPVYTRAVNFLVAFYNQVNEHSDGWAYWRPPVKAAQKLMVVAQNPKATEAEFKAALTPIRSFYTRRGYAAGMVFPEVNL